MCHNHLFLVLALACLSVSQISVAASPIALPGCKETCGNISIPYPFGIGPICSQNPWFEVECLENSFKLKKLGIFGSKITLDPVNGERTLVSIVPCSRICGGDGNPQTQVFSNSDNLKGSPFLFSRKRNVLLVNSCGSDVIIRDKNNKPLGGCAAVCNTNTSTIGVDCYGINCCQTTISSSIDFYSLEVSSIGSKRTIGDECTRAVLVDASFIRNKKKNLMHFQGLCDPAYVVLEWSVKDLPVKTASYADASCVSKSPSADDAGGYVCRCKNKSLGNPYLPYGCRDGPKARLSESSSTHKDVQIH
ncbi:wall-associated receptor kinase-like 8 isoform X1 [Amaranthus tricolor]|uniref:wall-associated receptor kinase-like 8 isoform X1 n=1 Tax=Amaranthus tricolor TaxID=29722 RepID=UPI002587FF7A|nr:wall-associated receptor kinase-like 8 isoform X1 [Amaranthus tricolor]